MATRLVKEFDLLHISIGKALRRTLSQHSNSALAKKINKYLHEGKVVPDSLAAESVASMLQDTKATVRGLVFRKKSFIFNK